MKSLDTYGLTKTDLDAMVSILKNKSQIDEVVLFGSRAKGTQSNGSDIDIALKGHKLVLDELLELYLELESLGLPYKIDLVQYYQIKEPALTEHIDGVGKTLFKRQTE
jgi:uncharacterized protein